VIKMCSPEGVRALVRGVEENERVNVTQQRTNTKGLPDALNH
jgi:hypothetical protein